MAGRQGALARLDEQIHRCQECIAECGDLPVVITDCEHRIAQLERERKALIPTSRKAVD